MPIFEHKSLLFKAYTQISLKLSSDRKAKRLRRLTLKITYEKRMYKYLGDRSVEDHVAWFKDYNQ